MPGVLVYLWFVRIVKKEKSAVILYVKITLLKKNKETDEAR